MCDLLLRVGTPFDDALDLAAVPLFPLPNVVFFPGAILPLHIFEERYKLMTADALEGNRQVAMALLKTGWEKDYYVRPPIHRVVCLGKIISHERLADGTYNFLLQGVVRAQVLEEGFDQPYRTAMLAKMIEVEAPADVLDRMRRKMTRLFSSGPLSRLQAASQFQRFLNGPATTQHIADLVAFHLVESPAVRQELLEECDVEQRVGRVLRLLDETAAQLPPTVATIGVNPSLN